MAQLRGAAKSSGSAFSQLPIPGLHDGEAQAGRACRFRDFIKLDRSVPGGCVVAYGVEVSAVRKDIWAPPVDTALHQLRLEQGSSGVDGAGEVNFFLSCGHARRESISSSRRWPTSLPVSANDIGHAEASSRG